MRNVFTIISLAVCAAFSVPAFGQDPDYVIIAAEHQNIENNPAYMDLRPDDVTRHLYLWENTAIGATQTDSPYEGNEYTRLTVNSGWFGLGFISDVPLDMSVFERKDMVLHFALRTTATCPLQVRLEGGAVRPRLISQDCTMCRATANGTLSKSRSARFRLPDWFGAAT